MALVVLAAAGGCSGESRVTLDGLVTLHGRPLPHGIVRVYGAGDRLATATIRPDGTFIITDVFTGPVRVAVADDGFDPSRMPPPPLPAGVVLPPAGPAPARVSIPGEYADPDTSGLAFTITRQSDRLDIHLE